MEWLQDWAANTTLLQAVLWVAGAASVVVFFWKGWPALKRSVAAMSKFVQVVDSIADLPQFMTTTSATLAEQDVKIAEIHHEVHFNNGSSVKDAVTRVEKKLDGLLEEGTHDER